MATVTARARADGTKSYRAAIRIKRKGRVVYSESLTFDRKALAKDLASRRELCLLDTFKRLEQMVRPGGWIGVMTCFQTADARFARWHYRRDPTHVVFYRERTMAWLAQNLGLNLEIPAKDVAFFQHQAR